MMLAYRVLSGILYLLYSGDIAAAVLKRKRRNGETTFGADADKHCRDSVTSPHETELSRAQVHLDRFAELFTATPQLDPPSKVEFDPMKVRPVSKVGS